MKLNPLQLNSIKTECLQFLISFNDCGLVDFWIAGLLQRQAANSFIHSIQFHFSHSFSVWFITANESKLRIHAEIDYWMRMEWMICLPPGYVCISGSISLMISVFDFWFLNSRAKTEFKIKKSGNQMKWPEIKLRMPSELTGA